MSVVELPNNASPPDTPFAVGAVVQLRSGGVHVTVRSITKTRGGMMVTVDWMDAADTHCCSDFDARQLHYPAEKEAQGDG